MTKICFIGIFIGTYALAVILFVMHGFEQITHEKLRGINAQITIRSYGDALNVPHLTKVLTTEFPAIASISSTTLHQALIQAPHTDDATEVVILKAIDPERETQLSVIEKSLKTNKKNSTSSLASLLNHKSVIIGSALAKTLDVQPGNPITLFYADAEHAGRRSITFNTYQALVAATFCTGIDEFDSAMVLCSYDLINAIAPDIGVTQLNVNLNQGADEDAVAHAMRTRLGIDVSSWKELYPALVAALKLEKYAMFFILLLIVLIACTNGISLQYMHIMHKRGQIALLKAMGMPATTIKIIFILMSSAIACCAALMALLLAGLTGLLLNRYPCITLPDAYYTTHVPIAMEWYHFIGLFIIVMLLSIIAAWLPTRSLRTISIVTILKKEG